MSDSGVNISTGDPMVDAILQGGGGLSGMADSEPLGGIFAGPTGPHHRLDSDRVEDPTLGVFPTNHPGFTEGIASAYRASDVQAIWSGMPLEDRIRLQDTMVSYGLTSSVLPGEFDDGTVQGIEKLLVLSNRAGTNWRATLGRLRSLEEQGLLAKAQQAPEFEADPYLAPDYATVAQRVKGLFREELGRDPDEGEMAQFQAEIFGWDRHAYERDQEFERIRHEQQTTEGAQDPGTVTQVDPIARFYEKFDEVYANERQFLEDKEQAVESRDITQQMTNTLSNMSRGA